MDEKIERKLKKLARRLAESNTWSDYEGRRTPATFADAWKEAYQLIVLTGHVDEYEKRAKQIVRARL